MTEPLSVNYEQLVYMIHSIPKGPNSPINTAMYGKTIRFQLVVPIQVPKSEPYKGK